MNLNEFDKTGLHPVDCRAIAQMLGLDEPSPIAAIGLGI